MSFIKAKLAYKKHLQQLKEKDRIPFSHKVLPDVAEKCFMVVANGKNMEPPIKHGDWIICVLSDEFKDGEIVALIDSDSGKFHCKHYRDVNGHVFYEDSKGNVLNGNWTPIAIVKKTISNL